MAMPTKTQREREAQQREEKLERINSQIQDGSLVVRKMTDEERARFARKREERAEDPSARGGGRRRSAGAGRKRTTRSS